MVCADILFLCTKIKFYTANDFSIEELEKFELRYQEGFDLTTDSRYNMWLNIRENIISDTGMYYILCVIICTFPSCHNIILLPLCIGQTQRIGARQESVSDTTRGHDVSVNEKSSNGKLYLAFKLHAISILVSAIGNSMYYSNCVQKV